MNTAKIIESAKSIFSDLTEIDVNIYKGILNIEKKVAGVFYIDLKNDKKENFLNYQEELISKEFYSNPGSLQWNYYLFLLNDQLTDNEISAIEKDDKYARKYVLDEKEFVDFFKIEEAEKVTQPNIVSEWKMALQEVDLQEVYTGETYVSIFDRFASNKTIKEPSSGHKKANNDAAKIQFINKLTLQDNYRTYPKNKREFSFGKVNLFTGINGVGKTSVFEGIELMLCGKSYRNSHQTNPNGCLEAVFNGAIKAEKYQGNDLSVYQSRDSKWYSSTYNRGNNLYNSFNRFNYFNADAAHSFASSKTESDVMDSLYSIVLGPEFGYIQERCAKMLEKVRPEYNKLKELLDTGKKESVVDQKIVHEYVEPESVQYIRDKINQAVEKIGFKQVGLNIATDLTKIEDLNSQVSLAIENLAEWEFKYNSENEYSIALKKIDDTKISFDILLEKVKSLGRDSADALNTKKELEKHILLLEKSIEYLSEHRYLALDGLSIMQKDQQHIKSKTEFVLAQVKDIDLNLFRSDFQIIEFEQSEKQLREQLNKDAQALKALIEKELEKIGKVDRLIKELKAKGSAYLQAAPMAIECPLCGSKFERRELEDRINQLLGSDMIAVDRFREDNKKLDQLAQESLTIERRINMVEKIKNAYQSFFGLDQRLGTVSETITGLENILKKSEEISRELDRLNALADFAVLSGKTESELYDLKARISQVFAGELEFNAGEINRFKAKLSVLVKDLSTLKIEIDKNISERYNKGLEIKLLLELPTEAPTDARAAEQKLESEIKRLELYASYIEKIKALVQLDETAKFTELKNKTDILRQRIQSYKDSLSAEFLVKQARERLEKNRKVVSLNTGKCDRFEKAYNCLVELTSGKATKRVEEFFRSNLNEVIDIFKSIHIPREFSNLKFENKRLTLIGDDERDERFITEISTGQRSALALSIFLSLNNKLANGPDLIMFDDPVAFIDDLNALSFLDYLRIHVLKSGKQIFFATANTRLAHLFEKKFAFLEEGFKQWHLERE